MRHFAGSSVVAMYYFLRVRHATITQLNVISVKDLPILVLKRAMLIDER